MLDDINDAITQWLDEAEARVIPRRAHRACPYQKEETGHNDGATARHIADNGLTASRIQLPARTNDWLSSSLFIDVRQNRDDDLCIIVWKCSI